jgi:hypothetical protein
VGVIENISQMKIRKSCDIIPPPGKDHGTVIETKRPEMNKKGRLFMAAFFAFL